MVTIKTKQRGTAGAFAVIAILLTTMVFNDYSGFNNYLTDIDDDAIYVANQNVYVGQEVRFYFKPVLTSDEYGIDWFMWDFHDGDAIYITSGNQSGITHAFDNPGSFLVSVMALRGNQSKIFTIPMTVTPAPLEISIKTSSTIVTEDDYITLTASPSTQYTPIINYLWEFGDSQTEFGQTVRHQFTEEGTYTVRVKAFTNGSLSYTAFQDIQVVNRLPEPEMAASTFNTAEDNKISFTAGVKDSQSDLSSMKYIWDFGDGLMASGPNVDHIYTQDGNYQVNLTVIDNNGAVGSVVRQITINNQVPQITDIWNLRNYYTEGETITSFSNPRDTPSDRALLNYYWTVPGDGSEVSQPYFEDGNYSIGLTVTDDNGASVNAETETFQVINDNPFASLLAAYTSYNITVRSWGTLNSTVNFTLFKNGQSAFNGTMINLDVNRNSTRTGITIDGLTQPLEEYWEILVSANYSGPFETYVQTTFSFNDQSEISVINRCSSGLEGCVSDSYRFPIAPLNRGFPIDYNFSVFDPGNDNLTLYLQLGSNLYTRQLDSPAYGPTSGIVNITGVLPAGEHPSTITYYIVDEDGGRSRDYTLPLTDYGRKIPPPEFANQTGWDYFGHTISFYSPQAFWNIGSEFQIGNPITFMLQSQYINTAGLRYEWNFGSGNKSSLRFPTYSYQYQGKYLLWTLIYDDYYEYVIYKWIEVVNPVPEYYPIIKGLNTEGSELTFSVSGLPNGQSSAGWQYFWDFDDGTYGYGNQFKHTYTRPGNYTVILTVNDRYNIRDTTEILMMIANTSPFSQEQLQSSIEVSEGNTVVFTPDIRDSPFDMLNTKYKWIINGNQYNTTSYWELTNQPVNYGNLTVFDPVGSNFTYSFTFNITANPIDISIRKNHYIYGNPDRSIDLVGTINPSVFEKDRYKSTTTIEYTLYDKQGKSIQTGSGGFLTASDGFIVSVNTSSIGTDKYMASLYDKIIVAKDLTDEISASGEYPVSIRLIDIETDEVIASTTSSIIITIDKDGDFIVDELEIMYSNTIDYLTFSINSTDSDGDGQADPVEYVLGNDADGDGLPSFYENIYGTFDNNTDTDGDGLTDGYGPRGELNYGTDGTNPDTDGDGLNDGLEVLGWQVELITPEGLEVISVTSDPTNPDTDGDGVSDFYEYNFKINPRNNDSDNDGLSDLREQDLGTSMLNKDSDFDGITDFIEATQSFTSIYKDAEGKDQTQTYYLNPLDPDSDQDGLSDYDELYIYKTIGTNIDSDRDGLNDTIEINFYKTNPMLADTDGDLLADGIEIAGFSIPIVKIWGGVYGEGGNIIQAPRYENYTIFVVTNPLDMDTDGDGLTDGEEIMGDSSSVSDPTSADSDGDGILDLFDPQKLVSDFAPPSIISDINVEYSIKPSETTRIIAQQLYATLSAVWSIMRGVGNLVKDLLNSFWYWKKTCVWGVCVKTPRIHSWSRIVSNVKSAFINFARSHVNDVFSAAKNFKEIFTNTLGFSGFSLSIQKKWGIPVGISIGGSLFMAVRNVVNAITGIVDPIVNFNFKIKDDSGIDMIKIYQDGSLVKTIRNINRQQYTINENFKVNKNGFSLKKTKIVVKIFDKNGNTRIIERTTSIKEFALGILEQGITAIKETIQSIIQVLVDAWNWALDGIAYLGGKITEAVNNVVDFVKDTYNRIIDWIKDQFNKIWEGFVRDTLNLLSRGLDYLDRAEQVLQDFSNQYSSFRTNIIDGIATFMGGPIVTAITDGLDNVAGEIDDNLPSFDKSELTSSIGSFMDPILNFFDGTVIKVAFDILSGKAMDILMDIVQKQMKKLFEKVLGDYGGIIVDIVKELLEQMTVDSPPFLPLDIDPDSGDRGGMIDMILSIVELLRNPAAAMSDMLNSFDGEYIMSYLDRILIDNPKYIVSLNDIVFTMLKPALALGLALGDLISLAGDAISGGAIIALSTNYDKESHQLNYVKIENNAITQEKFDRLIFSFIMKMIKIAYNEILRFAGAKDKEKDGDIEKEAMIWRSIIGFVLLGLTDMLDLVYMLADGYELNSDDYNNSTFLRKFVMTIARAVTLIISGVVAKLIPKTDAAELIVTWVFDILNWLINIADTVWYTVTTAQFLTTLSTAKQISVVWDLVATWLNMFYDPISSITQHGNLLKKIPPPAGAIAYGVYVGFAVITVFSTVTSVFVDFIVTLVES